MSEPDQPDQPQGFSLGGLSAGDYDTSLGQPAPDQTGADLDLPRGALLAFRKSGGLLFRTRAFVVYRDGWVIFEDDEARPARLSPDALDRLAHLALRARLGRHSPAGAAQPPDGYAYEVVARVGRSLRRAEAMTGAIPADLAPLIRALEKVLRGKI